VLGLGIIVLVASVLVERVTTIRSVQLVERAGGDLTTKNLGDERYAHEGGPPKWISAVALLSYLGIAVGLLLIVIGLV
jgi:hypothetical protein